MALFVSGLLLALAPAGLAHGGGAGGNPDGSAAASPFPEGRSTSQSGEAPVRPNLVLILADDLGARDLGCTGSPDARTPRLDQLAAQSMVFTQAYANCANCAPSRASILSGQSAPRTGVYTVGNPARGKARFRRLIPTPNRTVMEAGVHTFAEVLQQQGYRTGFVGKWHLGEGEEGGPSTQGFEFAVAGNKLGHPKSYRSPYRNPDLSDGPEGEYLTDRLTDEALRFVRRPDPRPFLLFLSFYAVHTPIQPPADLAAQWQGRADALEQMKPGYAAMVESLDRNVGRLLDGLAEAGHEANTVVVFTSDNGGHGGQTTMAPLRGSKGMFYEGGVRVPFFVRWPGRVPAGTRCTQPVIGVDLLPTFAELAGVEPPPQPLDGRSIVPLLEGRSLPERALHWHFPAYLEAYAGLKLGPFRTTPTGVIRRGPWKLHEFFEDGRIELYHLGEDPAEGDDRSTREPAVAARLLAEMRAWREELDAPVPTTPNPKYEGGPCP